MQIDWITVAAQAVNFLVLVYLLKHFLYRPVLQAMDRRQQRIAATMDSAQHQSDTAERLIHEYEHKHHALEQERAALLDSFRADWEQQRQVLLVELREEIDRQRHEWEAQVKKEQEGFNQRVRQLLGQRLVSALGGTLKDLADTRLEQQVIGRFIAQLQAQPPRREGQSTHEAVLVQTAFELSASQRTELETALRPLFGETARFQFQRNEALLCGIALESQGTRWGWSVESHLQQLELDLEAALKAAPAHAG